MDNVKNYGRADQATDENMMRRMRITCWISKATDTHSEYEILRAFPQQKGLRESFSILRYTYVECLVIITCPDRHSSKRLVSSARKSFSEHPGKSLHLRKRKCLNFV